MDPIASLPSIHGSLAPKPFAIGVLAVYAAGVASQLLLSGEVMARAGLWPFIIMQAALIWAWLVLHVRRLRDAGEAPPAAIGVALIYALSLALLLMLIAFLTNPDAVGPPAAGERPASDSAASTLLVLFLLAIVLKPDFGVFTTILKGLILIALLPALIALLFSIRTALRPTIP
jgi:uncharacterized membrane protein YhaH (DUF805 family)